MKTENKHKNIAIRKNLHELLDDLGEFLEENYGSSNSFNNAVSYLYRSWAKNNKKEHERFKQFRKRSEDPRNKDGSIDSPQ